MLLLRTIRWRCFNGTAAPGVGRLFFTQRVWFHPGYSAGSVTETKYHKYFWSYPLDMRTR
jgi:hypothetical protein